MALNEYSVKDFACLPDERGCWKTGLWEDFSTLAVHHQTGSLQTYLFILQNLSDQIFTLIPKMLAVLLLMDVHLCWLQCCLAY